MSFFRKIKASIFSPEFYSQIPQRSFKSAFGYFLLLCLFLAMLWSIVPIWQFFTEFNPTIDNVIKQVKNLYPSELTVKIQKGKVSTNVQEPYIIPFPVQLGPDQLGEDAKGTSLENVTNLIVIDTKTPFSIDQFNQYKSLVWLKEDSIFYKKDQKIEAQSFSGASDITIDKPLIDSLIDQLLPWTKFIAPAAIIGIFLVGYMMHSSRLVYLLFLTVLIWLLLKILKKPVSYWASYKVGLHAVTLGFLIELILDWIGFSGFPFMFTIISLIVIFLNFRSAPLQITTQQQNNPPVPPNIQNVPPINQNQ